MNNFSSVRWLQHFFSFFSSNSGDSYTFRPLTVVNDTNERDWSPVVTDMSSIIAAQFPTNFELHKPVIRRAGRKLIYEKIKESKILRGKLRSARKDTMTTCVLDRRVPEKVFGRSVPWTMRPLDDASLDDGMMRIPWTMLPLDDSSLGWCVPWMMRPLDDVSLTDVSRPWAVYRHGLGLYSIHNSFLGFPGCPAGHLGKPKLLSPNPSTSKMSGLYSPDPT
jgi:hypothetical protein